MSWFDGFGLLFVAALLVPNILFAATHPDGFENRYHNPTVERLEQVGRFGCFILMVLRIPVLCHGYWFDGGETVQLAVSVVLVTLYLLGWLVFWKEDSVRKSLALAILPSLLFLERGILIANIPLLVLAVLFAPCHIAISYGNAKALEKERKV